LTGLTDVERLQVAIRAMLNSLGESGGFKPGDVIQGVAIALREIGVPETEIQKYYACVLLCDPLGRGPHLEPAQRTLESMAGEMAAVGAVNVPEGKPGPAS
jgi:hypothetical protein